MKILAIRGRNLASLHGKFELDFSQSPLLGCGLFAITGETGAGKSTILDAMCLALYGRYPRITGEGPKDKVENIRGESLQNSDPRSILRTGSPDAYAQVDLEVEGKTLRASWQVRRAYGKAEGNLLDFERALVDLKDDTVLASGKKRVDEEITQRLKLTYEQFGRTVLLAQNDFDAFLRASDGDRADLLEKITGTELYSKISAKAYEKERQAFGALEELRRETGFISVLPDDERMELQAIIKDTDKNHKELGKKSKEFRDGLNWYARHDEALERVAKALEQADQVAKELVASRDKKQRLEKIEIALSLQPLIHKAQQEEEACRLLREEIEKRTAEQIEGKESLKRADKTQKSCDEQFKRAAKVLKVATPLFEQAQKLDTQIASQLMRESEAQTILEETRKRQDVLRQQAGEHENAGKQMQLRLEELEKALLDSAALASVSKRSNDLASAFQRLGAQQSELAEARQDHTNAERVITDLQKRHSADKAADATLQSELLQARTNRDEHARALRNAKPDEVRLQRDHQIDYQNQLNLLHQHLTQVGEQTALIDQAIAMEKAAKAKVSLLEKQLRQLEADLRDLDSRAAEADGVLTRSQSLLSEPVLRLRAKLQEGEPCAVCGSPDHPGHDDEAAAHLLELMRERTIELDDEIRQNKKQTTETTRIIENARAQMESAGERLALARPKFQELSKHTGGLYKKVNRVAAKLDFEVARKNTMEAELSYIDEQRGSNEHHMVNIRKQLMTIQQLDAQNRSQEERLSGLEERVQKQIKDKDRLEQERSEADKKAGDCSARFSLALRHEELLVEQILSMLDGMDLSRADLERDLAGTKRFIDQQINRHDEQRAQANDIKTDLTGHQKQAAVLIEKTQQQALRVEELDKQYADLRQHLIEHQKQRGELFEGKPVVQIRAEMEEAHEQANRARQEAMASKRENVTRLEELEKNMLRLEASAKKNALAQEGVDKARAVALAQKGLELSEVLSLLEAGTDKRNELMEFLQTLHHRKTSSAAQLADRKQVLEKLEEQSPPSRERDELMVDLREIEADRAMLMIDLGKNRSRLELDDNALKQRQKLSGRIEEVEKKHALWAVVSGAIGSRDGAKFRRFAQGVTLDHLVALANEQLRNINPRYKIERNRIGGLGLQVVDVEMAGETRSVRSLSGGERFLVSLALALALSRLDGRTSFVDTLMIDEGFGALDARSLDIVIEALESLQSQGRKVGVISHIEALTERIPVQIRVEKQGNGRSRVRVVEHGILEG